MHKASRLHYDLRLEMNGVLLSWAVPRGPSPNPADKRLAVRTEDHPLEYVDFEGVIPEGNYGAGGVIVWDMGVWIPLEDPEEGLEKGKLLFTLKGHKLQGRWTLVKTKQDWLFIKERDGWVREEGTDSYPEDSIFSGLTAVEVTSGVTRWPEISRRIEALGASQGDIDLDRPPFMLAESRAQPFSKPGWIFEIKYDGYRLLAARGDDRPRLISRNGNDLTPSFPELERALRGLPYPGLIVDGEAVVHDEHGLPSFERLQKRGRIRRRTDVLRASMEMPASLYAFDLLAVGGYDLRALPLIERKSLLRELLPSTGPIRYCDHIEAQGEAMFEHASRLRLEGVVGKDATAGYTDGRSERWLKVRDTLSDDFLVVGYTDPKGARSGIGALHLGQYDGDEVVYSGRVGTGFSAADLKKLLGDLTSLDADAPPVTGPVPGGPSHHWVSPELVVEVAFKEVTRDGMLRHPVFLRQRDDKPPHDCVRRNRRHPLADPVEVTDDTAAKTVHFSNLDKVFWPEDGYTKGDLVEYYRSVADRLLPLLADRPVVLTRFPDGIDGKSFFQKNAPGFAPDWVRTEVIWSEGSERELHYFICEDVESLLYLANSATIPLHVWSSRVSTLGQPDWCILDLDPKEAPFSDVVACARRIKKICDSIEIPSYVKTSGSTGLHVLLPLGRQLTYEQSRTLGQLMATVLVRELPDIATVTRNPRKREGKVYIDYVQNGHGRLLVSPYCVRPRPGAPVSAPLRWSEVNGSLDIGQHTIKTMPGRLARQRSDPWEGLLDASPDLGAVLARLADWLG